MHFSARKTLHPLSGQILYHFRISKMQSRFVPFIENFAISCKYIPMCCCLRYPVFSTFRILFACSPQDFSAFASITIGVLRKMIIEIVFTSRFVRASRWNVEDGFGDCVTSTAGRSRFSFYQPFREQLKPRWKI